MSKVLLSVCLLTPFAFLVGNAYVVNLLSFEGVPLTNLTNALITLPEFFLTRYNFGTDAFSVCGGVLLVCCVWIAYARYLIRHGEYRYGEEHGSARWANSSEIKAFKDKKNADNNLIFTDKCSMALKKVKFNIATDRNLNVMVIGGPGSGKTRYFVKPNLMQLNSSYFVTDPKGTLIKDTGWLMKTHGYRIRQFNTINFKESDHYNPLKYVKTESDIFTFVECLIKNTTGDKTHSGDPFWENAERLFYVACVAYLLNHCPEKDHNIPSLLVLLSLAEAREDDEDYMSPLDLLFNEIETGKRFVGEGRISSYNQESRSFDNSNSSYHWVTVGAAIPPENDFALSNYKAFKSAAGKTLKSILISCNVRLKPLSIDSVQKLLAYDEMALDSLGDSERPMIIYASMSDTNSTFNFLFALLMWQTMDVLCNVALDKYDGSLPQHVHFILDEFANIGVVPDFEKIIAVVRSRNISCSVILQSLTQLKSAYGDSAQTIHDCCDTTLFLGGKSTETNKDISEAIGKQTISSVSFNDTWGSGLARNYGKAERELIQASEVGRLPRDEALVLITGSYPIKDKKYQLHKHPRYKFVDPGHKGAAFNKLFSYKEEKEKINRQQEGTASA